MSDIEFMDENEFLDACGESFDHVTDIVCEDDEILQWVCLNCGAEGYEEKDGGFA